VTMSIKN